MIFGMSPAQVVALAREAKAQTGRSVFAQIIEMACLRLSHNSLFPTDYFMCRLFEPALSWDEKARYVGSWARARIYRIQDPRWAAIANNKIETDRHLRAAGFPVPEIIAHTNSELLVGFRIPDWSDAVDMALRASRTFEGLAIHSWDIAFSDRGPVLVEVNARGSVSIQLAMGKGFAQPELLALYEGGKI